VGAGASCAERPGLRTRASLKVTLARACYLPAKAGERFERPPKDRANPETVARALEDTARHALAEG